MNYYEQYQYVSNSELGALKKAVFGGGVELNDSNKQAVFAFGNLVDSAITERHLLNHSNRSVRNESTEELMYFSKSDWDKALKMADSVISNPIAAHLIGNGSKFQYAIYRRSVRMEYEGMSCFLPVRCKFDILNKALKYAADLKTTASPNLQAFIKSIYKFNYYRQGAFYMDLARIDKFWFIGISKKMNRYGKYEVFIYCMERGDEMYQLGFKEYNKLGCLYDLLITGFDVNNFTIQI